MLGRCVAGCLTVLGLVWLGSAPLAAQPSGGFLCSAGVNDGAPCLGAGDCPGGVCVRAQGVCDGGDDDGLPCDCAGGTCSAGTCEGGSSAGEPCDATTNCAGAHACLGTQKVCLGGDFRSQPCLLDVLCLGSTCGSSGAACLGGDADGRACIDQTDCPGGSCVGPNGTATPTRTATTTASATATEPTDTPASPPPATATPTPTRTRTSGPADTPTASSSVLISIGSAVGGPGDSLLLTVSITTSPATVVATGNDITFASDALSIDPASCQVNPSIGKSLHASIVQTDAAHTTVRVFVQASQNTLPIPNGALYTCIVRLSPAALPGFYPLDDTLALAIDSTGAELQQVMGASGSVTVSLIGGPCAGDCNHDGAVTVDELIIGTNIALGTRPLTDCLALNTNGDASVTVDELIAAVNNALDGCLTAPTPVPTPTPTQPPPPTTVYVRLSGSDGNDGSDPAHALRSIASAAQRAQSGYRIVVGPGTYNESVTTRTSGAAPQAVMFVADVTGTLTGDVPGPVVVDATGTAIGAGFKLSNSSASLIDGFTVVGAADGAVIVKTGSDNFTVQNCIIHDNPGSGIRVQDSAGALLFNNLVYANGGQGMGLVGQVSGSPDARVFSNTIVGNGDRGITVGTTQAASPGALIRNNILQDNGTRTSPPLENIKVFVTPHSDTGYDEDYDLVFPATYLPADRAGLHDIGDDAGFEFPSGGDFHLRPDSSALDAGDRLPRNLESVLAGRTTTGNGLDAGRLDLGFHYPP